MPAGIGTFLYLKLIIYITIFGSPGEVVASDTWRQPREEGGGEGGEWMEHREEEKVALESIYETAFQEKIAGQVLGQV